MKKILLAICVFALFLSGFTPVSATPQIKNPYTLIIATIGEPETVDPAWLYDTASAAITQLVYDTLIFFDRERTDKFVPSLATEWTISEDGLTYTFKIREGVKFHNDAPLTPADIEYSFERWMVQCRSGGPTWMILEPLLGVFKIRPDSPDPDPAVTGQMIDDAVESNATHVIFNLHMPYAPLFAIVAQSWAGVLNEEWCIAQGDWPGFEPTYTEWVDYNNPEVSPLDSPEAVMMGTGPYVFDYWVKGVEWTLVKNDDYFGGWPASGVRGYFTRVTKMFIAEWATRKMMFLAGDADIIYIPRVHLPEMIPFPEGIRCDYPNPMLIASPVMFFTYEADTTSPYLGVPGGLPTGTFDESGIPPNFFSDLDVRKGFAYSFDYDTYITDVFMAEAKRQYTPVPEPLLGFNPAQTGYELDLAKAEEHLKAAWGGEVWAKGFTLGATYNTGNEQRKIACEIFKAGVESINPKFHITIHEVDWPTYLGNLVNFELEFFALGWIADFPDPHNFVFPFMHSEGDYTYFQRYSNPTVDALVEEGIKETDPDLRVAIYQELQRIYVEDCISIPLAYPSGRHWEQTWIQGWYYNAIFPTANMEGFAYHLWKEELPSEDTNMDGKVNILDVAKAAAAFGSYYEAGAPHPRWWSRADVDYNEKVNIIDIATIAAKFGWQAPAWTPPT